MRRWKEKGTGHGKRRRGRERKRGGRGREIGGRDSSIWMRRENKEPRKDFDSELAQDQDLVAGAGAEIADGGDSFAII